MAQATFILNNLPTVIQCDRKEKMKKFIDKYSSKLGEDISSLFFLYNGKMLNDTLTFDESANSMDKEAGKMSILVQYKNDDKDNINIKSQNKYSSNIILKDEIMNIINNLKNEINELKKNQIPKGAILMWSGDVVPNGFALCDGKNGTPNLVNRFIIGSGGNYKTGTTGGNEKIKLNIDQLPPHNHIFYAKYIRKSGNHDSVYVIPGGCDDYNYSGGKNYSTNNAGRGKEIDILPPYYSLAYIMKI